ncbi:hypothetical protein CEE35_05935 [Candidatus Aerophobetes bacterium Ae_b3b]|nr:MAG: hypothetical protein CEE35_05935 [Candidatus Aerophobetes bacterium Ae_b3b]
MTFYHVRITQKSNRSNDETKVNLTEEELKSRFLEPYEKGKPIIINGKTITMDDLERIRISKSNQPAESLIEEIKREEASSSVVFIGGPSYEWEAADKAEDVTDDFIKGSLGYKKKEYLNQKKGQPSPITTNKVFVVYGHDHALKNDLEIFLKNIGLEPIALHRQPDEGLTIIEKLEKYTDVQYSFVLLTPDDVGYSIEELQKLEKGRTLEYRARQNVIFEFGYLIGRLGRNRVCCIYKEKVTLPTDISGLLYKKVNTSIEDIGYPIIKELKTAGYQLNL